MGVTKADTIAMLASAFPRQEVPLRTVEVYAQELDDVPGAVLEEVVRTLIRTATFFPLVSDIRAAIAETQLALPGEAEALQQIAAMIRWHRIDEADRTPPPPLVHPLVKEALDLVGGYAAFRTADEPGVIRGQFLRLYREVRSGAVQKAQVGALSLDVNPDRKQIA